VALHALFTHVQDRKDYGALVAATATQRAVLLPLLAIVVQAQASDMAAHSISQQKICGSNPHILGKLRQASPALTGLLGNGELRACDYQRETMNYP
jgi:hypothetical protein